MSNLINITDGLAEGVELVEQVGTARIGQGSKTHTATRRINPTTGVAGEAHIFCGAAKFRSSINGFRAYEVQADRRGATTCDKCLAFGV